ncbi:MAG: hypothetical protein WBG18_07245 [Xanthobacteraceae bacterium]
MLDWLIRGYDKTVLGLFKSRGGTIENEKLPPPIPGVIKLPGTLDLIGAIFDADCERQRTEHETRMTQIVENSDSLNVGTKNGVSFISFSRRR